LFKDGVLNRIQSSRPDVRRGFSGPGFVPGFFVFATARLCRQQDFARVTMTAVHRLATLGDTERLCDLRQRSILNAAPEFAGQGIGAGLLDLLEGLMRDRKIRSVHADASVNARGYCLRRGYRAAGPQTPQRAWPVAKELLS
jgi:GNAT superfamily N-acetyltransferase